MAPSCSFSPLYKNSLLSEVSFVEPNKSNKDLHNIYTKLTRLFFTNTSSEKIYIVTLSLETGMTILIFEKMKKLPGWEFPIKLSFI